MPPTAGVRPVAALGIQQEEIEREKLLNDWRYGSAVERTTEGRERTHAVQQSTLSFDHFIGSQHQASRDFVPNRLRGPEIDD